VIRPPRARVTRALCVWSATLEPQAGHNHGPGRDLQPRRVPTVQPPEPQVLRRSDNRAYTGGRASMPRQDSELPSIGTNPVNLRQLAREARLNASMMPDDGAAGGLLEYAADLEAKAAAMETEPGTLPRRARRK
jgi:hypothetical protein